MFGYNEYKTLFVVFVMFGLLIDVEFVVVNFILKC